MRIAVVDGDLQGALKTWKQVASENRGTLSLRRYYVGPAEMRRLKSRRARRRARRRGR